MSTTNAAPGAPPAAPADVPAAGFTGLDEYVRTIIALAIGLGGMAIIIAFWALRPVSEAEALSSVMTGLMGSVLGYYFGAHGKAKSDKAADDARSSAAAIEKTRNKVLAQVSSATAKLMVTGTPAGGTQLRPQAAGQKTPIDDAISDLNAALIILNPP